jgi:hypothetical protein
MLFVRAIIIFYLCFLPSLIFCQIDKKFLELKESELEEIFKEKKLSLVIEYYGCSFIKGINSVKLNLREKEQILFFEIYENYNFKPDSLIQKGNTQIGKKKEAFNKVLQDLKYKADKINNYKSNEYSDCKVIMVFSDDKYMELIITENIEDKEIELNRILKIFGR